MVDLCLVSGMGGFSNRLGLPVSHKAMGQPEEIPFYALVYASTLGIILGEVSDRTFESFWKYL